MPTTFKTDIGALDEMRSVLRVNIMEVQVSSETVRLNFDIAIEIS